MLIKWFALNRTGDNCQGSAARSLAFALRDWSASLLVFLSPLLNHQTLCQVFALERQLFMIYCAFMSSALTLATAHYLQLSHELLVMDYSNLIICTRLSCRVFFAQRFSCVSNSWHSILIRWKRKVNLLRLTPFSGVLFSFWGSRYFDWFKFKQRKIGLDKQNCLKNSKAWERSIFF